MTRRYFKLFDDMSLRDRWHLGQAVTATGSAPPLSLAIPLVPASRLSIPITHPGMPLDFSVTSFNTPVATERIANSIVEVANGDVQCIPATVDDGRNMVVLNVLRVVKCIDEKQSEFVKWTTKDHRPDLAGQYRQVSRLFLDQRKIPADAHCFRLDGWRVVLVVSEDLKRAVERAGGRGPSFTEVPTSPSYAT